mgnify:CR=1 FL=1
MVHRHHLFIYGISAIRAAERAESLLAFDRAAATGFRLDVPAGTGVRFEPGIDRDVTLVRLAGLRIRAGQS